MNDTQRAALIGLLWDYLKKDREHKDRRHTGFGTKTKQGLTASIERVIDEFKDTPDAAPTVTPEIQAIVTARLAEVDEQYRRSPLYHSVARREVEADIKALTGMEVPPYEP